MPFHTDTNIIPGESLGGITLGRPLAHYWNDITYYQETSENLHHWMAGHNSIVYELVDCFIEFRVHMPSCRIDRIAALPGFQGAFQNIIRIGMPTTQVENLGLGFYYNDLGECFVSPQYPGLILEPDLIDPLPYEFPFLEVGYITVVPTPDHVLWPQNFNEA